MQAALDGAREIGFTVISLTLSLIAVFIPFLFMTGLVGRMFREFAHDADDRGRRLGDRLADTDADDVLAALQRGGHDEKEGVHRPLHGAGRSAATGALGVRVSPSSGDAARRAADVVITIWLYVIMPKGFLPARTPALITAVIEGGPQISFAEMTRLQKDVAAIAAADPDVTGVASIVGIGQLNATQNVGSLKIMLKPRDGARIECREVIQRLKHAVGQLPARSCYFQPVQDVQISTRASRAQYQYTLASTDADEVSEWAKKIAAALRAVAVPSRCRLGGRSTAGLSRASTSIAITPAGSASRCRPSTMRSNNAFGQRQVSTIYEQANQYRVVLEAAAEYRSDPSRLNRLYVPSSTTGTQVLLTSVATMQHTIRRRSRSAIRISSRR